VFPISIPPLRERLADIEPLAREILGRLSQRFGEQPPALDVRRIASARVAFGARGTTAPMLGLKPTTLASKMKRLRIREGRRR
jgi:DNA-binding NtrC family response regulator